MDEGKVIPFLGAGANLCDRPTVADWKRDNYLPSGAELADFLAEKFHYPASEPRELVRVSQYVDLVMGGEAALFETLRSLFASTGYEPNKLHELLAERPARCRARGIPTACQLIVTTNYDDVLEQAFTAAGEQFDVVYHSSERDEPGRFMHVQPDGTRRPIPRNYRGFELDERTVILKVHGGMDRRDERAESYVITEDHYIDYLAHSNVSKLIPAYLMARMQTSHFLFLGYGMRDWNLRVILNHVWSQQVRRYGSWAIQKEPDPIDEQFWKRHDVDIVETTLEDWVDAMRGAAT